MALWKLFRGGREGLDAVPKHDGYVYFCDDGSLHFDHTDADGNLQRKQITAKEAEKLLGYDIKTVLNSSDSELPTSAAVLSAIDSIKGDISNMAAVVLAEAQSDASNKAVLVLAEVQNGITSAVNDAVAQAIASEEFKSDIASSVIAALPTWEGGSY